MRYREVEDVSELGLPIGDYLADATVVVTILMGGFFIAMEQYGKQRWLIHWGIISIISCAIYFSAVITHVV